MVQIAIVVLLALISLGAPDARAQYSYKAKFGSIGADAGQFNHPFDIAIEPTSRSIIVGDQSNQRVQIFDESGVWKSAFGQAGAGNGEFLVPGGVAVQSSTHNIYVVDGKNRVEIFNANGGYVGQFGGVGSDSGQFQNPSGVAFSQSNQRIIVVDSGNNRVQMFSASGAFISQFGSSGAGNGQFNNPGGVAVDQLSGSIIVLDQANNRVQIFNSNGAYITQFGGAGSQDGKFSNPSGVAVDPISQNIVVSDFGNNRVQIFNSSGQYLNQFGSGGSGNGQFSGPQGVAVNPVSRDIVVADYFNHRIQIFSRPPGVLSFTPSSYDFGLQQVGSQSAAISIKITNVGGSSLTISQIGTTGSGALEFPSQPCFVPVLLGPNDSCTVTVAFRPSSLGQRLTQLLVTSTGAESPQSVQLTGTGEAVAAPTQLQVPSTFTFGAENVGRSSAQQKVTLTNAGQAPVSVSSIASSNALEFAVAALTCTGTLNPATSCQFGLTFTPSALGTRAGIISVRTSEASSPRTMQVAGTGITGSGAKPEIVDIVEFYHAGLDHYFITPVLAEIDALDTGKQKGWKRTGRTFQGYATAPSGATPICRYYIPPAFGDSHFYSGSPGECAEVKAKFPSFVLESASLAYTVLPDAGTGTCPQGLSPVFRLWNRRTDSNHRYTTDPAIRDEMLARGYILEGYGPGVAMCSPTLTASIVLADSVKQIESTNYTLSALPIPTITFRPPLPSLVLGDVFVLSGSAYKANAVQQGSGALIVTVGEPALDEALKEAEFSGSVDLTQGTFVPEPGVLVLSKKVTGTVAPKRKFDLSFKLDAGGAVVNGTASLDIMNFALNGYHWDGKTLTYPKIAFNMSGEVQAALQGKGEFEKKLGSISFPIAGTLGLMQTNVGIYIKGEVELDVVSVTMKVGASKAVAWSPVTGGEYQTVADDPALLPSSMAVTFPAELKQSISGKISLIGRGNVTAVFTIDLAGVDVAVTGQIQGTFHELPDCAIDVVGKVLADVKGYVKLPKGILTSLGSPSAELVSPLFDRPIYQASKPCAPKPPGSPPPTPPPPPPPPDPTPPTGDYPAECRAQVEPMLAAIEAISPSCATLSKWINTLNAYSALISANYKCDIYIGGQDLKARWDVLFAKWNAAVSNCP